MSYQPPSTSSRNTFKRETSPKPADLLSSSSFPSLSGNCVNTVHTDNNKWFNKNKSTTTLIKNNKPETLMCKPGWAFISSSGVSNYYKSEQEISIRQLEENVEKWRLSMYHVEDMRNKEKLLREYGDYRSLGQELFDLEREREYEDSDVESEYSSDSDDGTSDLSDYDF